MVKYLLQCAAALKKLSCMDSNHDLQSQNLTCYRCTTGKKKFNLLDKYIKPILSPFYRAMLLSKKAYNIYKFQFCYADFLKNLTYSLSLS